MSPFPTTPARPCARPLRVARRGATLVLALLALAAPPAMARERTPFAAAAGVDLASAAAQAWAPDAALIYVENDEDVDAAGTAQRWGYLFYSPSLDKARGYSVHDGRILVAENLAIRFQAPPLAPHWIDSATALEAAERGGGREFREKHQGRLDSMLLMRGAFDEKDPDATSWTLIYTAPGSPSLFVVVDAAAGKVRRTWRG